MMPLARASDCRALVRKARMDDVHGLHRLLMNGTADGSLLPRSLSHLYGHVRDFFVLTLPLGKGVTEEREEQIVGCGALTILWDSAAEIRSLAVTDDLFTDAGKRLLVQACLEEAVQLEIRQVFSLTHQVAFFEELGFTETTKDALPQKIWADCVNCTRFPDCDELAVVINLPLSIHR